MKTVRVNFSMCLPSSEGREVMVVCNVTPGRPAVWHLRNGDPGYPEEPGCVDILSVENDRDYYLYERDVEAINERAVEVAGDMP